MSFQKGSTVSVSYANKVYGNLIDPYEWNDNFQVIEKNINSNIEINNQNFTDLSSTSGAENVGVSDVIGGTSVGSNVSAQLLLIASRIVDTYTKEQIEALTSGFVKNIQYQAENGCFVVTNVDGSSYTIDTDIEKIPVSLELVTEGDTVWLVLNNYDGSSSRANVTTLIDVYTTESSDTINMTLLDGVITSTLKDASVEKKHLSVALLEVFDEYKTACQSYAESAISSASEAATKAEAAGTSAAGAETSKNEAESQALLAKSYSDGTSGKRSGEDTDNAKYYSEQSKSYSEQSKNYATSASGSASAAATSEQSAATYAAELQGGIDKALAQAKASGEFDGEKGDKGEDGKTPVRGTDYWTDADKAEIVEDVNQSIDLSTYAKKTELDNYLPLKGGTCTDGITAPNFQTGSDESAYFQTQKMRGQGTANSYQHAVDWGYSGHNQVDFYEYGGIWNFWQCQSASKTNAVLRGSITNNGYEGSAALTGTPTAPTAAEGTNTTQIATTAFVQAAIGSIPEIDVITNAEIDTIVAA